MLKACPEIADYAKDEIASWRDLMGAAVTARSVFGVSPSAYQDACEVLGQERAAIVIACILQRAEHINSAGGYLRVLTEKAKVRRILDLADAVGAAAGQWRPCAAGWRRRQGE